MSSSLQHWTLKLVSNCQNKGSNKMAELACGTEDFAAKTAKEVCCEGKSVDQFRSSLAHPALSVCFDRHVALTPSDAAPRSQELQSHSENMDHDCSYWVSPSRF